MTANSVAQVHCLPFKRHDHRSIKRPQGCFQSPLYLHIHGIRAALAPICFHLKRGYLCFHSVSSGSPLVSGVKVAVSRQTVRSLRRLIQKRFSKRNVYGSAYHSYGRVLWPWFPGTAGRTYSALSPVSVCISPLVLLQSSTSDLCEMDTPVEELRKHWDELIFGFHDLDPQTFLRTGCQANQ